MPTENLWTEARIDEVTDWDASTPATDREAASDLWEHGEVFDG